MDSLENLDIDSDTTLKLIKEALKINIEVWIGYSKSLTYSHSKASIVANKIINSDLNFGRSENLKIDQFDFFYKARSSF